MVLAGAGTAADPRAGEQDRASAPVGGLALAVGEACTDVAVLGVDAWGSGWSEDPQAGNVPLRRIVRTVASQAAAAGSTVATRHLGVAFAGAATLADPAAPRRAADQSVTRKRAKAWRTGTGTAATLLTGRLHEMATACPEQAFLLAGTAQGASAVHRVLQRAAGDAGLQGRLAGAALVSDPDRSAGTRATLTGAPVAPLSGAGVLTDPRPGGRRAHSGAGPAGRVRLHAGATWCATCAAGRSSGRSPPPRRTTTARPDPPCATSPPGCGTRPRLAPDRARRGHRHPPG